MDNFKAFTFKLPQNFREKLAASNFNNNNNRTFAVYNMIALMMEAVSTSETVVNSY
jgi:hypothetical protein